MVKRFIKNKNILRLIRIADKGESLDESDIVSFEQRFKYFGVIFARSLVMMFFDKPKKERKSAVYAAAFEYLCIHEEEGLVNG